MCIDYIYGVCVCVLAPLHCAGVNGALHSAAGRCLLEECLALGGCDVGQAKMTSGYDLPARHVIHTVGPHGNDKDRAALLRCVCVCTQTYL